MTELEFDTLLAEADATGDIETLEKLYAFACEQIGGEPGDDVPEELLGEVLL